MLTIMWHHDGLSQEVWVPQRGRWFEQARLSYTLNEEHPGHGPRCNEMNCPQIPVPIEARGWVVP